MLKPSALFVQKGIAVALLVLAVLFVYKGSLNGVFVFDDIPAIVENPTLRSPVRWDAILFPPGDQAGTVGGRPLVNATLAINYELGGLYVRGYHQVNVVIHLLSALTLLGIVGRTLSFVSSPNLPKLRLHSEASPPISARRSPFVTGESEGANLWTAFAVALLWAVHPLQTESVTYVVQRAESLMGLFYLFTLYCFIRYAEFDQHGAPLWSTTGIARSTTGTHFWMGLTIATCLLGMLTKEVMVTAPLVIFLYDWIFISRGSGNAWRSHGRAYAGLAATWFVLAYLVYSTHGRGGSVGFASAPVWSYILTQIEAVGHYIRLAFWPDPLVFDYGTALVTSAGDVLWPAFAILFLLGSTLYALRKHPAAGFLGLVFFLLLAPSSSILPIATEPRAEHRMYLPLAALIAAVVIFFLRGFAKMAPRPLRFVPMFFVLAAAICLGSVTILRNRDYQTATALWSATAKNAPQNPRAHNNLAQAFLGEKKYDQAFSEFNAAIAIDPTYGPAQYNLGAMLLDANQPKAAIPHLEKALAAPLHQAETQLYLGEAYEQVGRTSEAVEAFRRALRLDPKNAEAAFGLGNNLAARGDLTAAVEAFRVAVANAPDQTRIRNNLANALLYSGRTTEAISQYREALARDPKNQEIRDNLQRAETQLNRL